MFIYLISTIPIPSDFSLSNPILWGISVALVSYIIKGKDKNSSGVENALKEIKDLITSMNVTVTTLKVQLEHNILDTHEIKSDIKKNNDIVNKHRIDISKILSSKVDLEKRVLTIEKELISIKLKQKT